MRRVGLVFRLLTAGLAMPATQPGTGRGKKKDHGFKVSADGRLIIREEEEDAATTKMEEEEGSKGEAACPIRECSSSGLGQGCARLFIHLFINLFICSDHLS